MRKEAGEVWSRINRRETSPAVQWLKRCTSKTGVAGLIPGQSGN